MHIIPRRKQISGKKWLGVGGGTYLLYTGAKSCCARFFIGPPPTLWTRKPYLMDAKSNRCFKRIQITSEDSFSDSWCRVQHEIWFWEPTGDIAFLRIHKKRKKKRKSHQACSQAVTHELYHSMVNHQFNFLKRLGPGWPGLAKVDPPRGYSSNGLASHA